MVSHIPFYERPLCSREEAQEALGGIGTTTFYKLVSEGKLEIVKIHDRSSVVVASLLRLAREGAPNARPRRPPTPVRRAP
ncbi:MAG: hypothetical protein WA417_01250 [Stellaceae bacterium]